MGMPTMKTVSSALVNDSSTRCLNGSGSAWIASGEPSAVPLPAGGLTCAEVSASVSSAASRLLRIAPNAATPIAPPRLRKNETPEVVAARSAGAAAFCAARIRIWRVRPSPTPSTATSAPITSLLESVCSCESRNIAAATKTSPITGKIFQRPVRVTICPDPVEVTNMPSTSGSVIRPDAVGLIPLTIWRYCGR